MTASKSPDKKEGGIDLKADSANISNSDIAGRDHIEGISGKELKQIIETLLKYFPKSYLKNPDELDKTLNDLRYYHEQLREYKELHNRINRILVAFEPFKAEMNRLNFLNMNFINIALEVERLRTLWQPVSIRVEELLDWSQTIQYIGKPFQNLGEKGKEGVRWAIQFSELQDQINHLGLSMFSNLDKGITKRKQVPSFQRSRNKNFWLKTLVECTSRFNDITSIHMDTADEQLRQTAEELLKLSSKALSK